MRPSVALAAIGVVAILTALLWPPCTGKATAKKSACLSTTKQQALSLLTYAADADDRLPNRDRWMDAVRPYTKESEWTYRCPEIPEGTYGYAFNAALSNAKQPSNERAPSIPMVYESVAGIRNASDRFASFPRPGRHKGYNSVAYADGHVKSKPFGADR